MNFNRFYVFAFYLRENKPIVLRGTTLANICFNWLCCFLTIILCKRSDNGKVKCGQNNKQSYKNNYYNLLLFNIVLFVLPPYRDIYGGKDDDCRWNYHEETCPAICLCYCNVKVVIVINFKIDVCGDALLAKGSHAGVKHV